MPIILVRRSFYNQSIPRDGIDRLEYHHWSEDPDQGTCLCSPCHDAIGGGFYDYQLDWRAQEIGLRDKHDLQILRLGAREQVVSTYDSFETLARVFVDRYDLIQSDEEVISILQLLNHKSIQDELTDDYFYSDLSTS